MALSIQNTTTSLLHAQEKYFVDLVLALELEESDDAETELARLLPVLSKIQAERIRREKETVEMGQRKNGPFFEIHKNGKKSLTLLSSDDWEEDEVEAYLSCLEHCLAEAKRQLRVEETDEKRLLVEAWTTDLRHTDLFARRKFEKLLPPAERRRSHPVDTEPACQSDQGEVEHAEAVQSERESDPAESVEGVEVGPVAAGEGGRVVAAEIDCTGKGDEPVKVAVEAGTTRSVVAPGDTVTAKYDVGDADTPVDDDEVADGTKVTPDGVTLTSTHVSNIGSVAPSAEGEAAGVADDPTRVRRCRLELWPKFRGRGTVRGSQTRAKFKPNKHHGSAEQHHQRVRHHRRRRQRHPTLHLVTLEPVPPPSGAKSKDGLSTTLTPKTMAKPTTAATPAATSAPPPTSDAPAKPPVTRPTRPRAPPRMPPDRGKRSHRWRWFRTGPKNALKSSLFLI